MPLRSVVKWNISFKFIGWAVTEEVIRKYPKKSLHWDSGDLEHGCNNVTNWLLGHGQVIHFFVS